MVKVNIPNLKLNNGKEIPALGYGTWLGYNDQLIFKIEEAPKLIDAMSYAIDIGYRHIDTAHLYRVEPEVGYVVNSKIEEGVVKREELFITTKRAISDCLDDMEIFVRDSRLFVLSDVWHHYHREEDVEVSIRASLKRLNLDYVDLALMHWPMSISEEGVDEKIDYLETWRGFESVLKKGLAKSIGVSNFNVEQLKRLLANSNVVPTVNQVELNLNLGQNELVKFCQSHNIVLVAYSPFGTMVPDRGSPGSPEPKLDNPTMVALGKKYGKSVSQITLRYLFQRGLVSIPKTVTKARVLENASIFDFTIDEEDVKTLAKFDNGYRTVTAPYFQNYTNFPFDKKLGLNVPIPSVLLKWKNGAKLDID